MDRMLRRSLSFESLESKQLLAGDVVVSLVGGNLFIKGDDAANLIAISANGTEANSFVIRGLEGTTVHIEGSTTPAPDTGLVVNGVRGGINVTMEGGDDEVQVSQVDIKRGLSIRTGAGNDVVTIHDARVRGVISVATGADDDAVEIGPADQLPDSPAVDSPNASVRAALIDVLLGEGGDTARVNSVLAQGAIVVGGGGGDDQLSLNNVRTTGVILNGGEGTGGDTINVVRVKAVVAVMAGGAGADHVSVVDSAFTSLNVALGSGDDTLSLQKVKAKVAFLAGGEGSADQYTDAGDNALDHRIVTGFELPDGVNTPIRPRPRLAQWLADVLGGLRV